MSPFPEANVRRAEERFAILETHVIRGKVAEAFDYVALCKDLGVELVAARWRLPSYGDLARLSRDALQTDHARYHPEYPRGPTIFYNKHLIEPWKTFFIAHELFHHLDVADPKLIARRDVRGSRRHRRQALAESLADSFAYEILAPHFLFGPALAFSGFGDLQRRFPLPAPELCTAVLSRLQPRDAFCLYFLPTGRGKRLSFGRRTITTFKVRVGVELSDQYAVDLTKDVISSPIFRLGRVPGVDSTTIRATAVWGQVLDTFGDPFAACGGARLLRQWQAQDGQSKIWQLCGTLQPVIGQARYGYRIEGADRREVWQVKAGSEFAEFYYPFVLPPFKAGGPFAILLVCFVLADATGELSERWKRGDFALDARPWEGAHDARGQDLPRFESLYDCLNRLRRLCRLRPLAYQRTYGEFYQRVPRVIEGGRVVWPPPPPPPPPPPAP